VTGRRRKEEPAAAVHDIDDPGRTAEDLLRELVTPHLSGARRDRLRERLVRTHLPLAADIVGAENSSAQVRALADDHVPRVLGS
jgi:hypothetical protein